LFDLRTFSLFLPTLTHRYTVLSQKTSPLWAGLFLLPAGFSWGNFQEVEENPGRWVDKWEKSFYNEIDFKILSLREEGLWQSW
jgi:hypothetical protein